MAQAQVQQQSFFQPGKAVPWPPQLTVVALCLGLALAAAGAAWFGHVRMVNMAADLPVRALQQQAAILAASAELTQLRMLAGEVRQGERAEGTATLAERWQARRLSALQALDEAQLAAPSPALAAAMDMLRSASLLEADAVPASVLPALDAAQERLQMLLAARLRATAQDLQADAGTLRSHANLTAALMLVAAWTMIGVIWRACSRARERQQAEAHLTTAKHQAEQANRAKSDFLANMSHELRTPLNAILGFSEMMRDNYLDPSDVKPYRTYAGCIHDAGAHLLSIIEDILDLTKIEAGRLQLKIRRHKVEEIVGRVVAVIGQRARDADVVLEVGACPQGLTVRTDERALRQILINLLGNAVKFTRRGGQVRLEVVSASDGVAFRVIDTGVGIAEKDLQRVLVPFEQCASSSYARSHEGTGLGLPIAKALVELHGGRLSLDSQLGEGTQVDIFLPDSVAVDETAAVMSRSAIDRVQSSAA